MLSSIWKKTSNLGKEQNYNVCVPINKIFYDQNLWHLLVGCEVDPFFKCLLGTVFSLCMMSLYQILHSCKDPKSCCSRACTSDLILIIPLNTVLVSTVTFWGTRGRTSWTAWLVVSPPGRIKYTLGMPGWATKPDLGCCICSLTPSSWTLCPCSASQLSLIEHLCSTRLFCHDDFTLELIRYGLQSLKSRATINPFLLNCVCLVSGPMKGKSDQHWLQCIDLGGQKFSPQH